MKICLQGAFFLVRPSMGKKEHYAQGKINSVLHQLEVYTAKYSKVKSAEEPPYTSRSTGMVCSVYLNMRYMADYRKIFLHSYCTSNTKLHLATSITQIILVPQ